MPPSDGRHGQLAGSEIQKVLDCLELIPEVQAAVQVFSAVKLNHEDIIVAQIVHLAPQGLSSLVILLQEWCVSIDIRRYTYIYVQIRTIYVRIRTHSYTFVHIRTHSVFL